MASLQKKNLIFCAKEKNTLCALLDRFQKRLNFLPAYFKGKYIWYNSLWTLFDAHVIKPKTN